MKRTFTFLFASLFLCVGTIMKAQVTVESPWTGNAIEDGQTYYLYNTKAKAFLKGANSWGTRASFGEDACPFIAKSAEGKYALSSELSYGSDRYLGDNLFVDAEGTGQNKHRADFVFEEVGEGIYTFNWDGAYYAYTGANTVETVTEVNDGCYWQLLTEESIVADMAAAAAANPYKVTALIPGANFNRNDARNSAWTAVNAANYSNAGGANNGDNNNQQVWSAGLTKVSQVLTGLPNGTYKLSAQSLYRQGGVAEAVAARTNGEENYDVRLFANEDSVLVMSVMDEAGKLNVGSVYGDYGTAPDNQSQARDFFTSGYYEHEFYFTVTDGTANIGIVKNTSVGYDWLVFDNFRLTYYGTATVSEINKVVFHEVKSELDDLINTCLSLSELQAVSDAYEQVSDRAMEIAGDENASVEVIDAYIPVMEDKIAEVKAIDGYYTAEYATQKAIANDIYDNSTADDAVKAAYGEALAAAFNVSAVATLEDLEGKVAEMEAARQAYVLKAVPTNDITFDYTFKVANPDMETGNINGWTCIGGWQFQNNNQFQNGDAIINRKFQEVWKNNAALGDVSTKQTISDIPNGVYLVSASIIATRQGAADTKAAATGVSFFANDASVAVATENNKPELFSVECKVIAGTLTFGIKCVDAEANWVAFDNVRLEYLSEVPKEGYVDAYNKALAEAQALVNEKMSEAAAELLDETLDANGSLTADSSIEELNAATQAISEALVEVSASVRSYKVLEVGGVPDNSLDGWTCTNSNKFQVNDWSHEGESDGTGMVIPFIQNWVAKGSLLGNGKISYTLAGVEPGYYKASSLIRVYSEAGNDISGASFFANDVKTDFATGKPFTYNNMKGIYDTYTAVVNVGEDGVLEFGVEINDPTFNWVSFKNVKIEYIGVIDQAAAEALKAKIPTTKYDAALAAEIEALVAAVDEGVTYENYLALAEKVALAETSAAAYATNKAAIDAMFALMESTNVYTVEAYGAYSAKAEDFLAQYEAGTLTATVDNPATVHGWRASVDYDDMLLSSFGVKDFESNLYINTWSKEGEDDGSEFKVPFFEYWVDGDKGEILPVATKTATMEGLNPGQYYSVEAWVRVQATKDVAAADATGITLSVGEGEPVDITEGEAIGDTRRSHAVFTAYGYADAEGKLTINFNVLEGNNISWLSFKNLKYAEAEAPVEPFTDFYTNPSGEEALESLGNIELFFFDLVENVVISEEVQATLTTPTIVDDEYFVASVWTSCYDNEDNPENVFKYIYFELEKQYTEPGEYVLTIPAGLFTVDGAPNAAAEVYFTVKEPAPVAEFDAIIKGVTPAEGEVTELDEIIVQFSNDEVLPYNNIFLTDEAGTQYEFVLDASHSDYTQAKYVAKDGAIIAAGTYTLDCSQIEHMNLMTGQIINPFKGTYSWTIKAVEDGIDNISVGTDAVIYDLSGRRVEKAVKGIYIVNGKKVVK